MIKLPLPSALSRLNYLPTLKYFDRYIFEKLAIPSKVGGNIGIACFEMPQNQSNYNYILEVSSYQLDLITNTRFNIACLLNITPDHIDRHGSFEGYITAKKRIFLNQNSQDFAIIDNDNSNSLKVFEDLQNDKNFKANLVAISTKKIPQNGVAVIDKKVFVNLENQKFQFKKVIESTKLLYLLVIYISTD